MRPEPIRGSDRGRRPPFPGLGLGLLALLVGGGCNREKHSLPEPASSKSPAPALSAEVPRHPGGRRIVAIGDLHGDLSATRAVLRLASAVDAEDRWTGGSLIVVQTGDQLDRGDQEREIVDLFERLRAEARSLGGDVLALNGNHEVMNVQGDFRYVTEAGFRGFEAIQPASSFAPRFPPRERARAAAFLPGGAYANKLGARDVIAIVGDNVFAHAGVLMKHLQFGTDRINREVSRWMTGDSPRLPAIVAAEDGPIWTRVYGEPTPSASTCRELNAVLSALKATRMIVGHTVQRSGISSACGNQLHRIDVGLSRHYGNNPIQALEVQDGRTRVLSSSREALLGKRPEKPQTIPANHSLSAPR